MKSKSMFGWVVLNLVVVTAAFAGENKHYQTSTQEGLEADRTQLCDQAIKGAQNLAICGKDEIGLPREVSIDTTCGSSSLGSGAPDESRVQVWAGSGWTCDTK